MQTETEAASAVSYIIGHDLFVPVASGLLILLLTVLLFVVMRDYRLFIGTCAVSAVAAVVTIAAIVWWFGLPEYETANESFNYHNNVLDAAQDPYDDDVPQIDYENNDEYPEPAEADLHTILIFVIGSTVYFYRGVPHVSEAAAFIDFYANLIMVPLRITVEALGAFGEWDSELGEAVIVTDDSRIPVPMETQLPGSGGTAVTINGIMFVPLGFVAELFDAEFIWDSATQTVSVLIYQ